MTRRRVTAADIRAGRTVLTPQERAEVSDRLALLLNPLVERISGGEEHARQLMKLHDEGTLEDLETHLRKHPPSAYAVMWLIDQASKQALTERQRASAKGKNAKARQWVVEQWASEGTQYDSKADFSRIHATLVEQRFALKVTAEQIARDWLPKNKSR